MKTIPRACIRCDGAYIYNGMEWLCIVCGFRPWWNPGTSSLAAKAVLLEYHAKPKRTILDTESAIA
jgi:hypothetical protein